MVNLIALTTIRQWTTIIPPTLILTKNKTVVPIFCGKPPINYSDMVVDTVGIYVKDEHLHMIDKSKPYILIHSIEDYREFDTTDLIKIFNENKKEFSQKLSENIDIGDRVLIHFIPRKIDKYVPINNTIH